MQKSKTREELREKVLEYQNLIGKYSEFHKAIVTHVFVAQDEPEMARIGFNHIYNNDSKAPDLRSDSFVIWARLSDDKSEIFVPIDGLYV